MQLRFFKIHLNTLKMQFLTCSLLKTKQKMSRFRTKIFRTKFLSQQGTME